MDEVWTGKERVHGTEEEGDEESSNLKGDPGSKDTKDELWHTDVTLGQTNMNTGCYQCFALHSYGNVW